MEEKVANRWLIAGAGVVMQVALGAVYAWSVFRKPLSQAYGTQVTEVNTAFTITIVALGISAFFGGLWMQRVGPRKVALTSGVLYGAGIFLASFAQSSIILLYLTYGLIAGIGIGLGYIVPIATLIKWFPDKRGLITGVAVAGFGAGAVVTAPIGTRLASAFGPFGAFAVLGVVYAVLVIGPAFLLRNPPDGYRPEGYNPEADQQSEGTSARQLDLRGALRTWQWFALWALLFLNTTAGIGLLSEAAPIAQEIGKTTAAVAATVVVAFSVANAIGRFFWASLSDAVGRKWVFLAMFALQAVLFILLPLTGSVLLFAAVGCAIVLCYGGGFGTMPAFAADYFGSAKVGQIYGLMLTAWSAAGIAGPLIVATVKDSTGAYDGAFYIMAGVMLVSAVIPFIVRPPRHEPSAPAGGAEAAPAPS
jgi:OFA family oxalate/formate antiporter-like MFS transporter